MTLSESLSFVCGLRPSAVDIRSGSDAARLVLSGFQLVARVQLARVDQNILVCSFGFVFAAVVRSGSDAARLFLLRLRLAAGVQLTWLDHNILLCSFGSFSFHFRHNHRLPLP